jgi:hypothetical protein
MYERVFAVIIILLGLSPVALPAGAAQSEVPNIKPPNDQTPSAPTTNLNIEVASDVYSDKDRQVLCCPKGNYMVVRNRIYLEGADLDKIKEVKYFLHETFDQPEGVMGDPAKDFEIWIWSWGGFLVRLYTTKTGTCSKKILTSHLNLSSRRHRAKDYHGS